mmetsp:Transcript_7049/g.11103  ORF Transcript_7049/g.11103 Transcript_7049/m.11103 type:complete len:95 (+) Transcript_7049:623-907(+)
MPERGFNFQSEGPAIYPQGMRSPRTNGGRFEHMSSPPAGTPNGQHPAAMHGSPQGHRMSPVGYPYGMHQRSSSPINRQEELGALTRGLTGLHIV